MDYPSPATAPQARPHGPEPTETTQNQPFFNQKPTPETSHDVGLSAMQLVGVPISRSNLCGVLGVFRTVCVLCVMLRFRSSIVRVQLRSGCDSRALSEAVCDCMSALSRT